VTPRFIHLPTGTYEWARVPYRTTNDPHDLGMPVNVLTSNLLTYAVTATFRS
jgi:hypothetical protein